MRNRIKKARIGKGLSQMDLAKALGWDTPQFVSNIERNLSQIPAEKIPIAAKMLGLTESIMINDLLESYKQRIIETVKSHSKRRKRDLEL